MKPLKTIYIKYFTVFIALMVTCYSCKKDFDLSTIQTGTVTDFDGNVYPTVILGKQEWMAENLKTSKFSNGVEIKYLEDKTLWNEALIPANCFYDSDSVTNNVKYGRLYNWNAISNEKNVCPTNWHVPTQKEWETLFETIGGEEIAGAKLKSQNLTTWLDTSFATNEVLFNAEPSGMRDVNDGFVNTRYFAYYWTATEKDNTKSSVINLTYTSNGVGLFDGIKTNGYSVRCVKD